MTRHLQPLTLTAVIAVLLCAGHSAATACSVPVFRYALERWPSDPYRVVVFHKKPLTKQQKALVEEMGPYGTAGEKHANVVVKTVDLTTTSDREMLALWASQKKAATDLPWMVVRYPNVVNFGPAWSGVLSESAVSALIDSPVRRQIAKRILSGETAVWILLESGDKKKDAAAYATLKRELAVQMKTLKLPEVDRTDLLGDDAAKEVAKLKIRFSVIRVSRKDPKEKLLVEMLLGSEGSGEDSLRDAEFVNKTMAFPIFGRGRIRYGLVGAGIAADTIAEACAYLTGPCKCQIKQGIENRGMDLVMAVDWNRMVTSTIRDKPAPPLLGLGNLGGAKTPTLLTRLAPVEAPKPANISEGPKQSPVVAPKPRVEITKSPRVAPRGQGPANQDARRGKTDGKDPDKAIVKADDTAQDAESGESPLTTVPNAEDSGSSQLLRNVSIVLGIGLLVVIAAAWFLQRRTS